VGIGLAEEAEAEVEAEAEAEAGEDVGEEAVVEGVEEVEEMVGKEKEGPELETRKKAVEVEPPEVVEAPPGLALAGTGERPGQRCHRVREHLAHVRARVDAKALAGCVVDHPRLVQA